MDEFDPNLVVNEGEEATPDNGLKKLVWVAIGIGAIGLVFGLAGMYMANQAAGQAEAKIAEFNARPDRTEELRTGISDINSRLEVLGNELVRLDRTDRQMQEGVRRNFETISGEVRTLRDGVADSRAAMGDLNKVVTDLRESFSAPRQTAVVAAAAASPVASTETFTSSSGTSGRTHAVRSGDTLSKIAAEYRVSLEALTQANPNVNPRNLQIGQQIVIP